MTEAVNIERALIMGDLNGLTADERLSYYKQVCESVGLNPLTKPFEYISLNGKLVLYPLRGTAEQLRKLNKVSISIAETKILDTGHYFVRAKARDASGREDESVAVVSMKYPAKLKTRTGWIDHPKAHKPLEGDDYANAIMKTETKAKRRVTLSICGLGMLDESEIETVSDTTQGESAQAADHESPLDKFEKSQAPKPALAAPTEQPMVERLVPRPEPVTVAAQEPAAGVVYKDGERAPVLPVRDIHEPDYLVDPDTGEIIPVDEREPDEPVGEPATPDNSDNATVVATGEPMLPAVPTNIKEQLANNRWMAWLNWFCETIQPMESRTAHFFANAWDNEIAVVTRYGGKHAKRLKEILQQKGVI